MKAALVCDFSLNGALKCIKTVIVKIVCKTLFSQELRDLYEQTMFKTVFNAVVSVINIVCP